MKSCAFCGFQKRKMGEKTCSAGSIVWVQRKNGTWWPGKILCNNEISTTGIYSPTSFSSRFPIKLLGRDNASVYVLSPYFLCAFCVVRSCNMKFLSTPLFLLGKN